MADRVFEQTPGLSRRAFLKLIIGALVAMVGVVRGAPALAAPKSMTTIGYGSGAYGAGKYGLSTGGYSIFLPVIRN